MCLPWGPRDQTVDLPLRSRGGPVFNSPPGFVVQTPLHPDTPTVTQSSWARRHGRTHGPRGREDTGGHTALVGTKTRADTQPWRTRRHGPTHSPGGREDTDRHTVTERVDVPFLGPRHAKEADRSLR